MLQSMTGFGKATFEKGNKKVAIEIKSLNSKQLDLNVKIPPLYKEKEIELRNEISKTLERGKVDVYVSIEQTGIESNFKINNYAVEEYHSQLKKIQDTVPGMNQQQNLLEIIMRLPEVVKCESQELDEQENKLLLDSLQLAVSDVCKFRKQEGLALEKDITERVRSIEKSIPEIEKYEKLRVENIRKRIQSNLNQFFEDEQIDKNRFEQELIFYLEKLDITEEKVRLKNHCSYFLKTCKEENAPGKKLGFISQEIGREINTIGSKANDFEIQRIVVTMKDELEKIKEQLMNVL